MSDWQTRLWAELTPHLPAGRVGLWAPEEALPVMLTVPEQTLLIRTPLSHPSPPKGAALQGLVVVAGSAPCLPWADFLNQLAPLAAPQAPLLLVVPRTGLVALQQPGWENSMGHHAWENTLRQSGWPTFTCAYMGGSAWPLPWATAACRLYVAYRKDRASGLKVQFKRKASGTASATNPLPC